MIGDVLIVGVVVLVIVAVIGPPIYRRLTGKPSNGCCGCSKCDCEKKE